MEFLAAKAPLVDHILSIYELKTRPKIVCYYHAVAGFPAQPIWISAITNGHYSTWPGLTVAMAARNLPESQKIQRGHERKIG